MSTIILWPSYCLYQLRSYCLFDKSDFNILWLYPYYEYDIIMNIFQLVHVVVEKSEGKSDRWRSPNILTIMSMSMTMYFYHWLGQIWLGTSSELYPQADHMQSQRLHSFIRVNFFFHNDVILKQETMLSMIITQHIFWDSESEMLVTYNELTQDAFCE